MLVLNQPSSEMDRINSHMFAFVLRNWYYSCLYLVNCIYYVLVIMFPNDMKSQSKEIIDCVLLVKVYSEYSSSATVITSCVLFLSIWESRLEEERTREFNPQNGMWECRNILKFCLG